MQIEDFLRNVFWNGIHSEHGDELVAIHQEIATRYKEACGNTNECDPLRPL